MATPKNSIRMVRMWANFGLIGQALCTHVDVKEKGVSDSSPTLTYESSKWCLFIRSRASRRGLASVL